ncbi:LAGLIDADG family homing endonuclease [Thermomonospora cellulosilytica]|uniref:Homing endonuclease LAGLIDADG domain-containing protein n=1 Tax=Thermomonospora cellulosilytica TaxID=1411118 RepID=A0A7W3N1V7_9ACTN|nr:LAGLIDADG family homing endonuclease [Thermomonospora cellulosilytica]MBA9005967.1 hypothetical protein [Thermomonospora cellulosilytica]
MKETELAWLAGIWDGEGSVGVSRYRRPGNVNQVIAPQVQIQMTHEPTVVKTVEILREMGLTATAYTWRERKAHHKDMWGYNISRTGYVLRMATLLLPYAVTKREHWTLIKEFCEIRVGRMGLDDQGRLRKGGKPGWWVPYSDRELELADQLSRLTRRGKPAPVERPVDRQDATVQKSLESQPAGAA